MNRLRGTTDFNQTRDFFYIPEGLIYLDGNSLGPLPKQLNTELGRMLTCEWGEMLIGGWEQAGWMEQPNRAGDRIARLIGAPSGTVTVGDTLSIKVYQALGAALALRPNRRAVLTDSGNFPSDIYMAETLLKTIGKGHEMRIVDPSEVADNIDEDIAALLLTEVDYRTGRRHDMAALSELAHDAGATTVWDLAHSAGAINVNVAEGGADFAVGCTYKYLNGGPGAPAFIYASEDIVESSESPLTGWLGHSEPFKFLPEYHAGPGISRMRVGTPPVIGLHALEVALRVWDIASIEDVAQRSADLTDSFIEGTERHCPELQLASPRNSSLRGSHVSFRHPRGYAIMKALIANRVIGDFREPDIMRFGFAPLYNSRECVSAAISALRRAIDQEPWNREEFRTKSAVT